MLVLGVAPPNVVAPELSWQQDERGKVVCDRPGGVAMSELHYLPAPSRDDEAEADLGTSRAECMSMWPHGGIVRGVRCDG